MSSLLQCFWYSYYIKKVLHKILCDQLPFTQITLFPGAGCLQDDITYSLLPRRVLHSGFCIFLQTCNSQYALYILLHVAVIMSTLLYSLVTDLASYLSEQSHFCNHNERDVLDYWWITLHLLVSAGCTIIKCICNYVIVWLWLRFTWPVDGLRLGRTFVRINAPFDS